MRPAHLVAFCLTLTCLLWPFAGHAQETATVPAAVTTTVTSTPTVAPTTAATQSDAEDERLVESDVGLEEREAEKILDPGELPAYVSQLLEVAIGELGYREGHNNQTKYGEWSGDANAAWCAEFVCWCIDQTDQRFGTALLDNVYPNYSGQNTGRDWFITQGRFVYRKGNCPDWGYQWLRGGDSLMKKNDYIPKPGDLIFFSYNQAGDTEHVALVEYSALAADDRVIVHVIEGNNPSSVQRNSYSLSNSQVLGFGTCQDVVDTTMRSGNRGAKVLRLQQWLVQLGYLEAENETGTYGSNTRAAVAAYQQTLGDKAVTGIADRETQQAIEAEICQIEFDTPETWLVSEE